MSQLSKSGPDTSHMMRAWTFTRRGLPSHDLLKLSKVPKPTAATLQAHEVLIKVHYSSIKPLSARAIMPKFPHLTSASWTPEIDYAGTIEAIGSAVNAAGERFKVGDQVFGSEDPLKYLRYGGTAREYLVLPADLAVHKPTNMDLEQAAALGANACTTVQFLNVLNLKKGDKVLVTGASGSLGTMLIPAIRATIGDQGRIVGVCSGSNADRVKSLGADETVDYKVTTDLSAYLKEHHSEFPFNVIVDIAGADEALYFACPAYLHQDGTFLFAGMVNTTHGQGNMLNVLAGVIRMRIKLLTPVALGGVPRKSLFLSGKLNRETLETVKAKAEEGLITVNVAKTWDMEELVDAYELMIRDASGAGRGNHVLRIQG